MRLLIPLAALALLAGCADRSEAPIDGALEGLVRDAAGIIPDEREAALEAGLERMHMTYGPQLAVVTVASLDGRRIEDASRQYANSHSLGDARRKDGLLLLVAPSERKVRIEVATGLERSFPDSYCQDVIDRMLPHFKAGDFAGGIEAGVADLSFRIASHPTLPANDNTPPPAGQDAA